MIRWIASKEEKNWKCINVLGTDILHIKNLIGKFDISLSNVLGQHLVSSSFKDYVKVNDEEDVYYLRNGNEYVGYEPSYFNRLI